MTCVDADLATLRRRITNYASISQDHEGFAALARVEAELSRLREQRDAARGERDRQYEKAVAIERRAEAAEAEVDLLCETRDAAYQRGRDDSAATAFGPASSRLRYELDKALDTANFHAEKRQAAEDERDALREALTALLLRAPLLVGAVRRATPGAVRPHVALGGEASVSERDEWEARCHFCGGPSYPWLTDDGTWAKVEPTLGQQQACFECFAAAWFKLGHNNGEPFQIAAGPDTPVEEEA